MTEKGWEQYFPSHRTHAFTVYLGNGIYLSDDNKGVPYKLARVFRSKDKSYEYANRYKGQVEIINIDYSMVGIYQREPLEYPKIEEI